MNTIKCTLHSNHVEHDVMNASLAILRKCYGTLWCLGAIWTNLNCYYAIDLWVPINKGFCIIKCQITNTVYFFHSSYWVIQKLEWSTARSWSLSFPTSKFPCNDPTHYPVPHYLLATSSPHARATPDPTGPGQCNTKYVRDTSVRLSVD